jgi:Tol biopolymer transport system component
MELVEGEDLSDRIARGRLSLADTLTIAAQIADALETAHEQGIVHRDLKPANIKVRDDGGVKVLDFGLAKVLAPDGSGPPADAMNSPTLTARATQLGMILGTAAYMAPEQARGRTVDRRADIWAFGVVLYEMLTGQRAFPGADVTEVLAKIIEREPDLSRLPLGTPPSLRRLIARCLHKDPRQRLRDIGEARVALGDAQHELTERPHGGSDAAVPVATSPFWRRALPWALALALGATALALLLVPRTASQAPARTMRLQITLPPGVELYTAVGSAASLSPDGATLAFVGVRGGTRQVFLRRIDAYDIAPLRGSETAVGCVFSPDGRELLVGLSDSSLRRVRLTDGLVRSVTPGSSDYSGAWAPGGRVVFSRDGRLWLSGETPDSATRLTEADAASPAVTESSPAWVPGADAMLFVSGRPEAMETARIEALSLPGKTRTTVVERATSPVLTASGHLLFVRDGVVLAAPFDPSTLTMTAEAVPVLRDVSVVSVRGIAPLLTVSDSGVAVYASTNAGQSEVVSVTREGAEQTVLTHDRVVQNLRLSPSGRQLLFEDVGAGLTIRDLTRGTMARLTETGGLAGFPIFSPDGREAVFRSPVGIYRQPLEGSPKSALIAGTTANEFPSGFTADGTELLYTKLSAATAGDIYAIPLAGGTPRALLATPAYEGGAQVSPDGRWLLYVSNELGPNEVFIRPYPALDRRTQVSSAGGSQPLWNPRGGEIFYRNGDRVMSVRLTAGSAGPVLSQPVPLFSGRYAYGGGLTIPSYAVTGDGNRFILVKQQSEFSLNVILNWFEELRRAAPVK